MRGLAVISILILIPSLSMADLVPPNKGKELYIRHCSSCHHPERYGIKAPPLLPETMSGYGKEEIADIIKRGLPATQMPPFSTLLSDEEIGEIVSYITSPATDLQWGLKDISESREEGGDWTSSILTRDDIYHDNLYGLIKEYQIGEPNPPLSTSHIDPEDITLVVESGKGISVMDGHNFRVIDKFEVGAIHGGPKFSHSLRYVYAATRDGFIVKYDLKRFRIAGRVRAGINTRNIAISHDDRYIAVANNLPENITILDGELNPLKIIPVGRKIGGVYLLHDEERFICSFRNMNELWLIDYKDGFRIDRLTVPEPFEDMAISPFGPIIIGASRRGEEIYIYNILERKVLGSIKTKGMPHLASAAFWLDNKETPLVAINHLSTPTLTVIDLDKLKVIDEITLSGKGYFVRTHQDTPYIWADTGSEVLQIIDKENLKVLKNLIPSKGKRVMHTEFTKDGRYAMVSLWEDDGAVIIYDAYTIDEVKRIPFRKPAGKYNALNKTFPYGHRGDKRVSAK